MVTINATMDLAICREVLTNLRNCCKILGDKNDIFDRCEAILSRVPAYQVNEDGALAEWLGDEFPDNCHHRHQSHLYPVFPGLELTAESDPELFDACGVAVEKRLVIDLTSQTGWSMAHMANIYARLAQPERAVECLDILMRAETGPNLLTYHNDWRGMGLSLAWPGAPPFQIDANFGMSAAILEMLVVSTPDCIRILPGLPERWETGRAGRIACRGQVTVALEWDQSRGAVTVELCSQNSKTVSVRLPRPVEDIQCKNPAVSVATSPLGDCYRQIDLPSEKPVVLRIQIAPRCN